MAYTKQNTYTKGAKARAESVDGEFTAIQTAWIKLVEFTGFTAVKQITENAANRAFKVLGFDTNGDPALVPDDTSARANKFIGYNADGDFALKQSSDLTSIVTPASPTTNSVARWATATNLDDSDWVIDGSGDLVAGGDLTTATDTDLTLAPAGTGKINLNDEAVKQGKFEDYAETFYDHGTVSTTQTVTCNLQNGNRQKITVSGSPTITLAVSNWPASGSGGSLHLVLINAGLATWNWPAATDWPGGGAPDLTSSGRDRVVLYTEDAGTTIDGNFSVNYS